MEVTIASPSVVTLLFYILSTSISLALLRIFHSATNLAQWRTESFLAREVGVYPLSRYLWRKKHLANPIVILVILSLGVTALPPLMWQSVRVSSSVIRETGFVGGLDVDVRITENPQARLVVWQPLDDVCSGLTGCDLLNSILVEIVKGPGSVLADSPSVPFREASTGVKPMLLDRNSIVHLETGQTLTQIIRQRRITVVGSIDILEALPYSFNMLEYLSKHAGNPSGATKIPPVFQYRQPGGANISVVQGVFNYQVTQAGVGPQSLLTGMSYQRFKVFPRNLTGVARPDDLTAGYQYILKNGVLGKSYWLFVNNAPGGFAMVTCGFGPKQQVDSSLIGVTGSLGIFGTLFSGPLTRDYLECAAQVGSIYQLKESVQLEARTSLNIPEVTILGVLSACNSKYLTPGYEDRLPGVGVSTALTNLELVIDSSAYCANIANNVAAIINNKGGLVSYLKTTNIYTVKLVYTLVPTLLVVVAAIILAAFSWVLVKDRLFNECLWVLLEDACKSDSKSSIQQIESV